MSKKNAVWLCIGVFVILFCAYFIATLPPDLGLSSHEEETEVLDSDYEPYEDEKDSESLYQEPGSGTYNSESFYDSDDPYDSGYDDVYWGEDYDIDRYDEDPDYANGVDDAIDDYEEEFGEDW